jgi:DNA processing protein
VVWASVVAIVERVFLAGGMRSATCQLAIASRAQCLLRVRSFAASRVDFVRLHLVRYDDSWYSGWMQGVAPQPHSVNALDVLALTLIPGLGPVLVGRVIRAFGSPTRALEAGIGEVQTVPGIGATKAKSFVEHRKDSLIRAKTELAKADVAGATVVSVDDVRYPSLLRQIQDPPPVIFVRGALQACAHDQHCVAIVGSRSCTQYGREQTERFATALSSAGLTVVSGGARGIDSHAHRAALRSGGRTAIVLGCGVGVTYPPENHELFEHVVASGRGCIVSELPVDAPPSPENFPNRNRIISGMSLGVVVLEAAKGSGSLITARLAAEDHGREVFAVPGRVDSSASEGTNDLLKKASAHLVTSPSDVLEALRAPAAVAQTGLQSDAQSDAQSGLDQTEGGLFGPVDQALAPASQSSDLRLSGLTDLQRAVLAVLDGPRTFDELVAMTGQDVPTLRTGLTVLEIRKLAARQGGRFVRCHGS